MTARPLPSSKPPRPARRPSARAWVLSTALLLAAAVLAVAWAVAAVRLPVDSADATPIEFTVPSGATVRDIGRRLEKAGLIRSAVAWRAWLWLDPPAPLKAGRHLVTRAMNVATMAATLAGRPLAEDAPLTLVEGWRLVDVDAFLAQAGLAPVGAYLAAAGDLTRFRIPFETPATTLEGYLLPETYRVPVGPVDVDKLIQRQLDAFNGRFVTPHDAEIRASGRALHTLVTVASMLEREEHDPARRPQIAGVIYKRLDGGIPLGIDATSRYRLAEWNDRDTFLVALRDPADPYNTRLKDGLPPTAIGAPSLTSLQSALRPVAGPFLYYLHDAQGGLHLARTAAEHESNRRRYNVY